MNATTTRSGNILKASDTIYVRTSKWTEYEMRNIHIGEAIIPFIVGMSNVETNMWEYSVIDSRQLLDSLITLAGKVDENPKKSTELMLRWCRKNGLPFFGNDSLSGCEYDLNPIMCGADHSFSQPHGVFDNLVSFDLVASVQPIVYGTGVSLKCFKSALRGLHEAFVHASWVTGTDDTEIKRRIRTYFGMNPTQDEVMSELSLSFLHASLHFDMVLRNGATAFEWKAYTLFNAAYYQLGLLMISKESFYAKSCTGCGSLFLASRRSKVYCSDCTPQKRWNRKNRKQKKETDNASENKHSNQ